MSDGTNPSQWKEKQVMDHLEEDRLRQLTWGGGQVQYDDGRGSNFKSDEVRNVEFHHHNEPIQRQPVVATNWRHINVIPTNSDSTNHSLLDASPRVYPYDAAAITEIDQIVKRHAGAIINRLEDVMLSEFESRIRHLEACVDNLKASIANDFSSTNKELRQLDNILREVQGNVKGMRDKQLELQISRMQISNRNDLHTGTGRSFDSRQHLHPAEQLVAEPRQHQPPVDSEKQKSSFLQDQAEQYLSPRRDNPQGDADHHNADSRYQPRFDPHQQQHPILAQIQQNHAPSPQEMAQFRYSRHFEETSSNIGVHPEYGSTAQPTEPCGLDPSRARTEQRTDLSESFLVLRNLPLTRRDEVPVQPGPNRGEPDAQYVPLFELVNGVSSMGFRFPTEWIIKTIKDVSQNGQAVDMNAVLDKLMKDGEANFGNQ